MSGNIKKTSDEELQLEMVVQDKMLEVANLYNEVSTSDLQGIAHAEAKKIIQLIRAS